MDQTEDIFVRSEFWKHFLQKITNVCPHSYGYPKNYGNYYGGNQFQNFRDFADLKKHKKSDRRRFF